jgi:hypothetical protein
MDFRPLDSPRDLASEYNSGWRFGVAVGSSVVLCYTLLPLLAIALELICP